MKSRINANFRTCFGYLPEKVKEQTRAAYRLFKQDPNHPSLHFKKVLQNYQFTLLELVKVIEQLVA